MNLKSLLLVRRLLVAGLLLGGLSFLTGCGTPVRTADPTAMVAEREGVAMDRTLRGTVQIGEVHQNIVGDDMLQVQVEVQNRSRREQSIQYAFEWFNEAGILITSPPTTWKTRTLQGHETIFLTAVAPMPEARDFRIKLMDARTRR